MASATMHLCSVMHCVGRRDCCVMLLLLVVCRNGRGTVVHSNLRRRDAHSFPHPDLLSYSSTHSCTCTGAADSGHAHAHVCMRPH